MRLIRSRRFSMQSKVEIELSFCVVNTEQRPLLRYCLDAIARERATVDFATEVLVLDNASQDGSADAARQHSVTTEVLAHELLRGKAENDTTLLQRARGRFCLLLNEDSELEPGATVALHAALAAEDSAGAAGCMLVGPDGEQQPSAWKFPSPWTAFLSAVFLHRRFVVQSRGDAVRRVDWAHSAALLVRRDAAEAIGFFDREFFAFTDEIDFCRRLADAGWETIYVPEARAVRHDQVLTGDVSQRRIVEAARNRDRYMRKHHSAVSAFLVRCFTAWTYAIRTTGALLVPGRDHRRNARHVVAALAPGRGEGLAEAAEDFNRRVTAGQPTGQRP
jgi:N-acetylglucosaminyl-diphospho-decaprenol L-rhamnosyltransferase